MEIKPDFYMLFGFRNLMVNPNDYLPDFEDSEADAPWQFNTKEGADKMASYINGLAIDEVVDSVYVGEVFTNSLEKAINPPHTLTSNITL